MLNTDASVAAQSALQIPSSAETTQAFGQTLTNRLGSFYRKAYRILGNSAEAEDAVQDALLAAFVHLDQFKGQSEMSTWVAAIVHNSARLQLRRRRRHVYVSLDVSTGELDAPSLAEQLPDPRPNPEDECQRSQLRTRLTDLCSQLSPTLRGTFRLRDIEGVSIRETARILKIPCGTVKARSARARRKLNELMQRALSLRSRRLPNHKQAVNFDSTNKNVLC